MHETLQRAILTSSAYAIKIMQMRAHGTCNVTPSRLDQHDLSLSRLRDADSHCLWSRDA